MSLELLLTISAVFVSVGLASWSVASLAFARIAPDRKRLHELVQAPSAQPTRDTPMLTEVPSRTAQRIKSILPLSPKQISRLRRRLVKAGYHGLRPALVYTSAQLVCLLVFGGVAWWLLPAGTGWILAVIAAAVGYMLPTLVLDHKIKIRQKMIQNGLPDALDLFIVCLEAGSSLDQAIIKASNELEVAHPALTEELRMLTTETRAGKPRLEAFRNFSARTGVDDVRALVSMLTQTDKFGTSVAQALRTHAETSRTKRRQRAEERAAKIGVKLVFPLVFCLFPAFYVVTLGPAVVKFVRVFFGEMQQAGGF